MTKLIKILIYSFIILIFFVRVGQAQISFGNPNGKIVLIEYFDYNCPACFYYAPVINSLVAKNPDLKVIQKVIPVMTSFSNFIDSAVLASFLQNKFFGMQEAVTRASNPSPITPQKTIFIARELGINIEQLKRDMQSKVIQKQLADNLKEFKKFKTHKLPVTVIYLEEQNSDTTKKVFVGAYPKGILQDYINQLREVEK
jgi:predicted DsbA family dithiol-disulfide isomerase